MISDMTEPLHFVIPGRSAGANPESSLSAMLENRIGFRVLRCAQPRNDEAGNKACSYAGSL